MTQEVKIEGLAELDKLLQSFAPRVEANILRGSLNAANKVILQKARELAPVDDGDLKASIRVTSKIKRANGWVESRIVAGNKKAYYANWVEFGTGTFYSGTGDSVRRAYLIRPRTRKALFFFGQNREQIRHPGIKPQPFMRPAFDREQGNAIKEFGRYMKDRIAKEFKKQAKAI